MPELDPCKDNLGTSPKKKKIKPSMWKILMMFGLIVGLLIPLTMISGLINERQVTKQKVVEEISQTWAGQQSLIGPVLAVPYKIISTQEIDKQKKVIETRNIAFLLPQQYQVQSKLKPEVRYRGIYQSVVYSSHLTAQGNFDLSAIKELNIEPQNILWKEAWINIGISSTKGISQHPELNWQSKTVELLPGVNGVSFLSTGLYAPVSINPEQRNMAFKLNLSLKGSEALSIVPIGKQNTLQISSTWRSPSFIGNTLPGARQVNQDGFAASWEIPYFARDYGQVFTNTSNISQQFTNSAIGVQLLTPVDSYRQTDRAIKYGILFLVLTFSTYFLFEIIGKHRLHSFQYLLIGLAISLFYLLLLAVSEVAPFGWAYGLASFGIILVITLYSKAILCQVHKHAEYLIGALLVILYSYLYILLQLEDLSLLFGAIGLFIVLAIVMYVTRNIDWYGEQAA